MAVNDQLKLSTDGLAQPGAERYPTQAQRVRSPEIINGEVLPAETFGHSA